MVRAATVDDAAAIARVHVATWRDAYQDLLPPEVLEGLSVDARTTFWRGALKRARHHDDHVVLVETVDGAVAGFASGGPERGAIPPTDAEAYALYVLPEHQGRGVGARLLRELRARLAGAGFERMGLWVLEGNLPARRFYEAHDGTVATTRTDTLGGREVEEVSYTWLLTSRVERGP